MLKKSSKFKQAFELNLYLQSQINFKKTKQYHIVHLCQKADSRMNLKHFCKNNILKLCFNRTVSHRPFLQRSMTHFKDMGVYKDLLQNLLHKLYTSLKQYQFLYQILPRKYTLLDFRSFQHGLICQYKLLKNGFRLIRGTRSLVPNLHRKCGTTPLSFQN